MSFFAEAETFVFWDMDECKIPNDLVIESLYKNIKSALANEGYHGNVSIRGYGRKNHIGDEFLPEGFTFIHERLKGNRRDFRIWEDSFLSVDHFIPCNVMLIVHDDALAHLENSKRINILVAQNVIKQSLVQKLAAASVWLWKSLSRGGSPNCLNESACTMISSKTKISLPAPSPNKPIMISDSIPNELILEILLRLPAKSVARFHCVSKLWASIFDRPYFKELFLTRSLARPQLLFSLEENGVWSYFSLPQHQMSLVVAAEFHMKFPPENIHLKFPPYNSLPIYSHRSRQFSCGYASGLIYLYAMWIL